MGQNFIKENQLSHILFWCSAFFMPKKKERDENDVRKSGNYGQKQYQSCDL